MHTLESNRLTNRWHEYIGPEHVLGWRCEVSGGYVSHAITYQIPKTTLESEEKELTQLRLACHVLLDLISDRGLPEVLESIRENIQFYSFPNPKPYSATTRTERAKFKFGEKYERPVFHLVEE